MVKDKNNPSLSMVYEELLELKQHVAENHNDINWLKDIYKTLSNRQWYIVSGIIISILIELILLFRG